MLAKLAASRDKLPHDVAKMEAKISKLLASEKAFATKLDRLNTEKEELSEQLNAATLRYFKAEKKLDRAKSTQVQKLEQQAFANATRPAGASNNSNDGGAEAKKEETNGNHSEILLKYEEATAAATKQKQQLDSLLAEIRTIQEENTNLKARREAWSDEDLVRSDIFKQFKLQNEDLIKRINNVEASNKQLREEAETMRADRSAFRAQLEADANQVTQELEAEIVARDQDLARVRSARDEILAQNTQRKASMDQEKAAIDQIKELAAAKDERISALESEISRLKPADDVDMAETDDGAELPVDELRAKYKKLQVDFRSINQELPSIEKAYRKMKDLAQRKVTDFAALEERVAVLIAEKSKADQKYFAARKDADTRNNEIRSLRHQNSKSAEIIAQLKDHEAQNRSLLGNLEKQLSDLRQANATLVTDNKRVESAHQEAVRLRGSLSKQVADLTGLVKAKDAAAAQVRERNAAHETESEKLKVRLETMTKDRDNWKSKALSNSSEEEEMLRVSSPRLSILQDLVERVLTLIRHSPSAPSAATTLKTRPSRRAATSSATSASRTESATACASARRALGRLTRWTSWLCTPSRGAFLTLQSVAGRVSRRRVFQCTIWHGRALAIDQAMADGYDGRNKSEYGLQVRT